MTKRGLALLLLSLTAISVPATNLLAAEALTIPEDVRRVTALRYPRNADHLRAIQDQVQRVSEQAKPATVGILVGEGAGSGVIVSPEGLVLTAGHVISRPGRRATILLTDGRRLKGVTLGANHAIDAGMVQLDEPPADLPYLPIAKAEPKIGEWVIATGQPGGTVDDRAPPVRLGRVLAGDDDWLCTDCTLVGGDSGGPLINLRGEVLAVHSSIGPKIVHNFHVPVLEIQKDWKRLLAGELWGTPIDELLSQNLRPVLGIAGRAVNNQVVVTQAFPKFPAFEAGVRPGDIVLRVDNQPVAQFEDISKLVLQKRPGQTMRLQIQRDGKTFGLPIILAGVRIPSPPSPNDNQKPSK